MGREMVGSKQDKAQSWRLSDDQKDTADTKAKSLSTARLLELTLLQILTRDWQNLQSQADIIGSFHGKELCDLSFFVVDTIQQAFPLQVCLQVNGTEQRSSCS